MGRSQTVLWRRTNPTKTRRPIHRSSKAGKFKWPKGNGEKAYMFAHFLMDNPELRETLAHSVRNSFMENV